MSLMVGVSSYPLRNRRMGMDSPVEWNGAIQNYRRLYYTSDRSPIHDLILGNLFILCVDIWSWREGGREGGREAEMEGGGGEEGGERVRAKYKYYSRVPEVSFLVMAISICLILIRTNRK